MLLDGACAGMGEHHGDDLLSTSLCLWRQRHCRHCVWKSAVERRWSRRRADAADARHWTPIGASRRLVVVALCRSRLGRTLLLRRPGHFCSSARSAAVAAAAGVARSMALVLMALFLRKVVLSTVGSVLLSMATLVLLLVV